MRNVVLNDSPSRACARGGERERTEMRLRLFAPMIAAALLAPGMAYGLGTIEGFYGWSRPPSTSFRAAVDGTTHGKLFKDNLQIAGGDVLLNLQWLEVGAIGDVSWASGSGNQTALGGLIGTKIPLALFRLDLLGEVGAHKFGNFSNIAGSSKSQWLMYVGLRPGLAYSFGVGGRGLLVGVWGFVRWDVTSNNVQVTASDVNVGHYKLGGTTVGATLRVGVDF